VKQKDAGFAVLHWVDLQAERKKGPIGDEILKMRQWFLLGIEVLERDLGIARGSLAGYRDAGFVAGDHRHRNIRLLANLHGLIASAYHLGSLCPGLDLRAAQTETGRKTIATKVQRRQEALTPLVLEEAKAKRKGIPERALKDANKLLKAKGLVDKKKKGISPRAFATYVSRILADNPE
jgi:hypothetical protein